MLPVYKDSYPRSLHHGSDQCQICGNVGEIMLHSVLTPVSTRAFHSLLQHNGSCVIHKANCHEFHKARFDCNCSILMSIICITLCAMFMICPSCISKRLHAYNLHTVQPAVTEQVISMATTTSATGITAKCSQLKKTVYYQQSGYYLKFSLQQNHLSTLHLYVTLKYKTQYSSV